MKGPLRVHTTSPACVHAVESSDDGSPPCHRSSVAPDGEAPGKKTNRRVTKLILPSKLRRRISQAFRSLSRGAKNVEANHDGDAAAGDESDVETFVSAKSSELRSSCADDGSEAPSFRLSPLIFPTGSLGRPPPASPVRIVQKLPFGYVIGRQQDVAAPPPPLSVTTLARSVVKKGTPLMAALCIRSRSQIVNKKVVRAVKETLRRGGRRGRSGGAEADEGGCGGDDEDVFWKKDVRGLRCRRVEDDDDDAPY
ncbi:hypothetical protein ACP70R_001797 [Stipagrostis hirtigluma subsp. patula]